MKRTVMNYASLALAATLVCATSRTIALGQTSGAPETTLPSSETVRALLMNNWNDSVAIHYARQLYNIDSHVFGPYLVALHNRVDWPTNQINGATAFFRADVVNGGKLTGPERAPTFCESSGEVKGDNAPVNAAMRHSYPSAMCFDNGGILHVEYLRETESGLPIQIEKSYAMAPNQRFLVVRYTLTNNILLEDQKSVHVRFTEVVDLHNKTEPYVEKPANNLAGTGLQQPQLDQPIKSIQVQWHPELNAWIADMSASNGTFVVFGAFQDMDRHRAFQTVTDQLEFPQAIEPEVATLDNVDLPQSVDQMKAWDLGLSMWKDAVLGPTHSAQYAFFYAITSSLAEAQDVARQALRPVTPEFWFTQTAAAYENWIQKGQRVQTPDAGLREAYIKALITAKQSQQPEFGTFTAATNPAYGFKVWARDSSATALGLAAAGHLQEAMKYYTWMASVQEGGNMDNFPQGTWFTTYSYWVRKMRLPFVEPENDSLGLFMTGVYQTWRLMKEQDPQAADAFLTDRFQRVGQGPTSVYDAVTRAADYIERNIDANGFGPKDFSIWEEDLAFTTFTQVSYASGLNAARLLAEGIRDTDRASRWLNGARRIRDAIVRPASAKPCPGLWNDAQARWNRATRPDCTRDDRLDSSTDLVWVFGLVDAKDSRAASQRNAVLSKLNPSHTGLGIARYEGDTYYYTSPFNPGGPLEASTVPAWPQMDMYVDMLEHWTGMDDSALKRLQWSAKVTNAGYMPPGEAVDPPTNHPLPSTSSEPVTGAWYVMGILNFLDLFDPRLPPL
jgi:GH15 family glucan-1,4-alpha-glucosidase